MANYYARSDEPVRAYYARTRVRPYADEPRVPTLGGGDASSNLDHELEAMMLSAGEDNADDDGASDLES